MTLSKNQKQVIENLKANGKHSVNFNVSPNLKRTYNALTEKGLIQIVSVSSNYQEFDLV